LALVLLGLWLGIELGPRADAARAELAQLPQPSPSQAPPPKPMPPRPRLPRPELRRSSVGADIAAVRADTLFAGFRAHLAAGRLAEARTALESALARTRQPIEREVAEFDLVEIMFFEARFDTAASAYRTFAIGHPRGYLTNDAIARMFLLDENSSADEQALRLYADASREQRIGRGDSAASILRLAVSRYKGSELEDDLRLLHGDVLQRLAPPSAALEEYRTIADTMADSPLAAAALLRIGTYYLDVEHDVAASNAACEQVLTRFPDSVEAGEARKLIDRNRRGPRPSS
jgi:outer membrane protein assembly factor BamD (BamD/ComL family)